MQLGGGGLGKRDGDARACPEASRVAQKVEAAGPTATATRNAPAGAMSSTRSSAASSGRPIAIANIVAARMTLRMDRIDVSPFA